jgi:hypothetical protein
VLLARLRALLGDRCSINLNPVIDLPAGHLPVDSYEIPTALREQLQLRYPADVFPYAAAVSRRLDLDHTIPYLSPDRGGPPGQTRIGNLGPHTAATTATKPSPPGKSGNPNPAPGSGDHPTAASTWSTPAVLIHSATPNSPKRSGVPQARRNSWPLSQPQPAGRSSRYLFIDAQTPRSKRRPKMANSGVNSTASPVGLMSQEYLALVPP